MNLFRPAADRVTPDQLRQLKAWVYQALALDETVPVSISQLSCSEPGCPPLETVIAVMTQPPKTYKIHQPAAELGQADVVKALAEAPPES
ncbi:MAG: hypothetical protein AAFY78_01935 [Cyanobacteria bacterium J06648_16]